jgi:molybdopterin-containing oxidoreductase family iron-sulfur binding subunit
MSEANHRGDPQPPLWRSLEHRWSGEIEDEFPAGAETWDETLSRRGFLSLLGAMIAATTAAGCQRAPSERILPYARAPRDVTPGVAAHYASSFVLDGYATGVLVESHEGRPTKIEGNPEHPASLGASDALMQAAVLGLYDPDRGRSVLHRGSPASYDSMLDAMALAGAARVHVLVEPTTSPTLIDLVTRVRRRIPNVQFHFDAPLSRAARFDGARMALGRPVESLLDLRSARVIVALDHDFLASGPMHLRHAREFANARRLRSSADDMTRLYAVEASPSCTGIAADHRFRTRPSEMRTVAAGLLDFVRAARGGAALSPPTSDARFPWLAAVARDLVAHAGESLVTVGDAQPPEVHAIVHAINDSLGNVNRTVRYAESPVFEAGTASHGIASLAHALAAGEVDLLLVVEGNPAYSAPADLHFATALRAARRSVYVGSHYNETAASCEWYVPSTHWLESWGDARAADGTASFVQPLIAPLFGAKQPIEVLAALLLGDRTATAHAMVREYWRAASDAADFESWWDASLQRGFVENSASAPVTVAIQPGAIEAAMRVPRTVDGPIEISFARDPRVHDGRFTNNAWLLELPDPITKLTWENAAQISPATAARHGLATEDLVRIEHRGLHLDAPIMVVPGQADDVVTLTLGYGRRGEESLARGRGVNASAIRFADAPFASSGIRITKLAGTAPLAITQEHWSMADREPVKIRALDAYRRDPRFTAADNRRPELLYQLPPNGSHQWGMSIDLGLCTGCSACVVACQAENNVPVVGKEGVRKSREMHWLRIDRYFVGDEHEPGIVTQPMACQHCESAPCEYVCPVNATVHSPDGLNEQVYNRCVGTRFCSNNCPYKVRRFNYLDYHRERDETLHMVMNPQVTVRARGVMEKCTYCVQRLRRAEITARTTGRALREVPVTTACAQACPTGAIVFGLVSDPDAEVTRMRRNERAYAVLHVLGTIPRTRYLARIRNPNRAIERERT